MKSIYEILKECGLEVPADKKPMFDKAWKDHYRTKNEYDNAVSQRDSYKASDEDDWSSGAVWYKANPSLGYTIDIEKVQNAYISAKENAAEENVFRQLRLNQWVKQSTRWMQMVQNLD